MRTALASLASLASPAALASLVSLGFAAASVSSCSASSADAAADSSATLDSSTTVDSEAPGQAEDVATPSPDLSERADTASEPSPDASSPDPEDVAAANPEDTGAPIDFPPAPERLGGDRPAAVNLPDGYTPDKAWPLMLLLHGYSANGLVQDAYLGISKRAALDGVIVVVPDGTVDSKGNQFWNATDACCNRDASPVDDDAYLTGLVAEARTYYHVDPKRIFSMGHSNGGFMSYRLACDHSDLFAGVVVLAGAMWKDVASCPAKQPVSVVHVHGTKDKTILYEGTAHYPSAPASAAAWVGLDGCSETAESGAPLDLDVGLPGAETTVERWTGCSAGSSVELWTIVDGAHLPGFADETFAKSTLAFLLAHPKP